MESPSFISTYIIYKLEDAIMMCTYKKITVDLDMAKRIVHERLMFYGGKSFPTLVDIRQAKLFTKEARNYFAVEGVEGMTALALVAGNHLTVIMSNLFMTFSRPRVPTKVFKTKEQALKWLDQFKANNGTEAIL